MSRAVIHQSFRTAEFRGIGTFNADGKGDVPTLMKAGADFSDAAPRVLVTVGAAATSQRATIALTVQDTHELIELLHAAIRRCSDHHFQRRGS